MALQIPKQHLPAIIKIRQLPDVTADQLITALASFPPTPDAKTMAEQIAPQVPDILPDDLKDIVDTLYALYYVREFSESGLLASCVILSKHSKAATMQAS
jgi:hypothetical protein